MKINSRLVKLLGLLICIVLGASMMPAIPVSADSITSVIATASPSDFAPKDGNSVTVPTITNNSNTLKFTDVHWERRNVNTTGQWKRVDGGNFSYVYEYRLVATITGSNTDHINGTYHLNSVTVNGAKWTTSTYSDAANKANRKQVVYSNTYKISVPSYTVKFDLNGHGDPSTASTTYKDQIVTAAGYVTPVPDPVDSNYIFKDWWTADVDGSKVDQSTTAINSNRTWYAHWEAKTYTLSFNNCNIGGTSPTPTSVPYNTMPSAPAEPSDSHYKFLGWFTKADGGDEFKFGTDVIKDKTELFAHWSINTYTVTFDSNGHGGTPSPSSVTGPYNSSVSAPSMSDEHYIFDGWYDANNNKIDFDTYKLSESLTLTAHWTPKQYTVIFDKNGHGAANPSSKTLDYGAAVPDPGDLSENHYHFEGWFDANNNKIDFNSYTVPGDVTLKAHWTPEDYEVEFNLNGHGGSATIAPTKVPYGSKVSAPSEPSDEDYSFDGWFKDQNCENPFSFDEAIEAGTILYAGWTKFVYAPYSGDNGTWIIDSGVDYKFTIKRSVGDDKCYNHFINSQQVDIDGTPISDIDYTAEQGSTIITLKAAKLQTLKPGDHTITVHFDDGVASIQLTVKAAPAIDPSPKTGDSRNTGLWIVLMASSVLGFAGVMICDKKRRAVR